MCSALPLLPHEYILSGWQYIQQEHSSTNGDKINIFLRYVKKQWLSRGACKFLSVFGKRHRTDNVCESWHSKINNKLNKKKANILRLLNEIKKLTNFKNKTRIKTKSRVAIEWSK